MQPTENLGGVNAFYPIINGQSLATNQFIAQCYKLVMWPNKKTAPVN
jgi:hypothetical protein